MDWLQENLELLELNAQNAQNLWMLEIVLGIGRPKSLMPEMYKNRDSYSCPTWSTYHARCTNLWANCNT